MELTPSFKIASLPARQFAYARNVGPYMGNAALFGRLFQQVSAFLQPKGLLGPAAEAMTIYHDNPAEVPPAEHRISVGFTIPEAIPADGGIQVMEIPAGDYLIASFEIHMHQYPAAWGAFRQYIVDQGVELSGEFLYEVYRNDPGTHPAGKQLVDICGALKT